MTRAATRLTTVAIPGPAGMLEGLLSERDSGETGIAAIVCHPHPLYGGTMHNKVVHRVASTLHELGAAVLRFNFRGVGASQGEHDQGAGELEDARAALGFIAARHPRARRWVAGFSFGAWVGARLAASEPAVERLILVAPPVGTQSFEALRGATVPKLVIQGSADTVCPPELLERELPLWAEPRELILVPGASHFFDKQLGALAHALSQALAEPARGAAP
jgi:alpha/beta superfamily hydrolase